MRCTNRNHERSLAVADSVREERAIIAATRVVVDLWRLIRRSCKNPRASGFSSFNTAFHTCENASLLFLSSLCVHMRSLMTNSSTINFGEDNDYRWYRYRTHWDTVNAIS